MSEKEKIEESKEGVVNAVAEEFGLASMFSEDISESVADDIDVKGGDDNVYVTSLKNENVVNGAYRSVVRFIKNPRNTKEKTLNVFSKFMYFIPNPNNQSSVIAVDCTSNWGQRDNIITNAFFYLKNTKVPSLEALAKAHFSRKRYWFTLLQIVKDIQQPELEGKIKVFRFANQINEKIEDIVKDDEATNQKGVNYSHPFTGLNFIINVEEEEFEDKVTKKMRKQTSYSKSKFVPDQSVMVVPESTKEEVAVSEAYAKKIYQYCIENSPALEDYLPKPWDKDLEDRIIESVRITIGDDNIFSEIFRKTYGRPYTHGNHINTGSAEKAPSMEISEEHLLSSDAPQTILPETTKTETAESGTSDDLPAGLADSTGLTSEEV